MLIKDKKNYLICLLVSVLGTIMMWVINSIGSGNNSIWGVLASIIMVLSIVAGILCGALGVYWSLVKCTFGKSSVTILFLPWLLIYWGLRLCLIIFVAIIGIGIFAFFPGVFAIIAFLKYRNELVD